MRMYCANGSDDPQHAFPGHSQMKPEQLEIYRRRKEVVKLKAERDILKEGRSLLREGGGMRFAFIARHRRIWPAAWLCEALDVSRSGFLIECAHREAVRPPSLLTVGSCQLAAANSTNVLVSQ